MLSWLLDTLGCGSGTEGDWPAKQVDKPPTMRVNNRFIGAQAQRLFHTLKAHYGDRGHVLAEVALNRLIWVAPARGDGRNRARWWGRIAQRSIDFVIIDPRTLQPFVAIELDDKSHLSERRESRDASVNAVCVAAGLRLVRVPGNVTVEELKAMLDDTR